MSKSTHHVVPNPNGGWSVKKGGAGRASRIFDTQEKAREYGVAISRNQGSDLVVHGRDGRVLWANRYGNDSYPPADKN